MKLCDICCNWCDNALYHRLATGHHINCPNGREATEEELKEAEEKWYKLIEFKRPPEPEYICNECAIARGAVWPSNHLATCHGGDCYYCLKPASLASVGDWDWPEGSKKPSRSAGRD